jgi:hypothetical protein
MATTQTSTKASPEASSNIMSNVAQTLGNRYSIDSWNSIVAQKIDDLSKRYSDDQNINNILKRWHKQVTIDYGHTKGFTPHVNGFYMAFMVHGTWYDQYLKYLKEDNKTGLSEKPVAGKGMQAFSMENPNSYLNMLATDIDIPDITEEYTSVSSRLRNSFVPARNYFVSDFSMSYIENINLDIMRYHEAWHKYMQLIRRGEDIYKISKADCEKANNGYFVEMPYANAVWVAVFKPFTTDIQLLIKLIGVMPVTMPLKQVVGNRSASKMTVLNISYKAADLLYKFYNSTEEFIKDKGMLAESFREEVMAK